VFFEGQIRFAMNNRNRAFVTVPQIGTDIMIDGAKKQNRALEGDTVIIEILSTRQWPP